MRLFEKFILILSTIALVQCSARDFSGRVIQQGNLLPEKKLVRLHVGMSKDEHHDHLVCIHCNHVVEFVDELIEERQRQIAKDSGFKMTDHSLHIYGVCKSCQKQGI